METPPKSFGAVSLTERLDSIEKKLDKALENSSETRTDVAVIQNRLALHDKILLGVCGAGGLAIVTAVLSKVIA
jgi:hypothetical protein